MPDVYINFVALFVAALAHSALGALWYSQVLFGKTWMKLSGITEDQMKTGKKGMGKTYALSFIGAFVMAYVLARFVDYSGASTIMEGMRVGFLGWLGFIATVTLAPVLWAKRPIKLYFLDNGHLLVSTMIMGAIVAVWR